MIGARVATSPMTSAYVALGACVLAAGLSAVAGVPLLAVIWVLLGVTAGYSISGSP